jgi:orotate phosphoribosyltransferase
MVMNEADIRDMQKRNLLALAKSPGAFKFTETFVDYTSGEIGPYYVQSAAAMANGRAYAIACRDMANMILTNLQQESQVISGGESRDWCFSGPVAQLLSAPHTMIYKRDESGQCKTIGADMKGKTVIHVADLNNEGSSPRDMWVPTIRAAGGTIKDIFFYVDRLESGVDEMKKLGLNSYAVIPLDKTAWDILQNEGVVSPEVYTSLCKRMENKDEWARNMLRSSAGLEELVSLLASAKTRGKVKKILNVGYPYMKDEIVSMMAKACPFGVRRWLGDI